MAVRVVRARRARRWALACCSILWFPLAGQVPSGAAEGDRGARRADSRQLDERPFVGRYAPELKRDYKIPSVAKDVAHIDLPAPPSRPGDDEPQRIGFHRPVPAAAGDLTTKLRWESLGDGRQVAAAIVTSPGAATVRLGMIGSVGTGGEVRVFVPGGAAPSRRVVTDSDFRGDSERLVWSPSVPGDAIGVEVTLPKDGRKDFSLTIDRVAHRHVSVTASTYTKALQCAHVDVQCRADTFPDGLEDAVARVTIEKEEGTITCSGTLLNSDEFPLPYFLTANHCVGDEDEAASIETIWFHEYPSCGAFNVRRGETVSGGADLLATSITYDSTLLRLRESPPAGALFSGWNARAVEFTDHPFSVFGIHHPGGVEKKYAFGATVGRGDSLLVKDALAVYWTDGLTEPGSSGSELFRAGDGLIGVLSSGHGTCDRKVDYYGALASFYPQACPWLEPDTTCTHTEIPFFSSAADPVRQGFVRLVNHSFKSGRVTVHATDDAGRRVGPLTIPIDAGAVVHFNSDDLETGNVGKGIYQAVGPGQGDWRLDLEATVDIEALAYIRTGDGFVTSMHALAEPLRVGSAFLYYLRFLNPGSNVSQVSKVRLINPHAENVRVGMVAVDDTGAGGEALVTLVLRPGEARTIDSRQLEIGAAGLDGAIGDGAGKWRLGLVATRRIDVMNLLASPTGNIANLSVGRRLD